MVRVLDPRTLHEGIKRYFDASRCIARLDCPGHSIFEPTLRQIEYLFLYKNEPLCFSRGVRTRFRAYCLAMMGAKVRIRRRSGRVPQGHP